MFVHFCNSAYKEDVKIHIFSNARMGKCMKVQQRYTNIKGVKTK